MRMRRGRKARVRWLPDASYFDAVTRHQFNQADGSSLLFKDQQSLLKQAGGEVPIDLQTAVGALSVNVSRLSPSTDTLIVDHIKGKFSYAFDGAGLSGAADADGLWFFIVRMAVGITMKMPEYNSGTGVTDASLLTAAGGASFLLKELIDPGSIIGQTNLGSSVVDGCRILWRRALLVTATASGGFLSAGPSSDSFWSLPTTTLDIKPRRILRPNEDLVAAINVQAIPQAGATGHCGVVWGQDLRVAAHNTARRR